MTSDLDPRPAQDWAAPPNAQNSPSTQPPAGQPATEPAAAPVAIAPVTPPSRRVGRYVRPAILATAFAVTFGVGIGVGRVPDLVDTGAAAASPAASFSPDKEEALIAEAWDKIHQNYVDAKDLDDRKLAYAAIDGMTEAVGDTGHTEFMTPEERAARQSSLSGSYVGIGAEVDTSPEGMPMVVGVFRGSPAEKGGLHAGDIMLTVDGKTTEGEDLETTISRVRGKAGTTVVLTVRNGADGPVRTVSLVRADVHIEPVSWSMVPGTKTAVLRLEQFSTGAADELKNALKEIDKAGAERLILDLRGNPGGFVNEAVVVASQFVGSGNVYLERNAKGEEKASAVRPGGLATKIPLVVMIDEGTASAAEIVSGSIQDAGRAQLVGEKTFGTGTVLGEFPLSDGSALRIGTVEWLTPKGRVIWHNGIKPDVTIARPTDSQPTVPDDLKSMSAAQAKAIKDPQLLKALQLVATAKAAN
jgi:carboxyl-terminal processing protease